MTETSSHPAIFAGLLGSTAWAIPTLALAAPADEVIEVFSHSLLLQFVVGCAAGAGIAGAVFFVKNRIDAWRESKDAEADEQPADDRWSESSLNLVRAQDEQADDDPTGDLGRYRTGQITIDLPVQTVESVAAEPRRPRQSRRAGAAHMAGKAPAARRSGRHFAAREASEPLVASLVGAVGIQEESRGRHFAGSVVITRSAPAATSTPSAKVAAQAPAEPARPETPELHGRALLAQLPVIDASYQVRSATPAAPAVPAVPAAPAAPQVSAPKPAPASKHPAEIQASSDSQESLGITGRLMRRVANRTRNVREVLAERLGSSAMDGVPVITRADGSVGDITPSWFDQTFVPAIANLTGITGKLDDTAERIMEQDRNQGFAQPKVATESSRAAYISRHVAEVNVGMFPERRSVEELEHKDAWEEALAAMGETIASESPQFHDVVGGPATIDDPDGMEGPTGFIPFRVPAAHPEVVDTETYIDYLLRDELSQNGAQVLRNSSHAHLRVIEGGTSPRLLRHRADDTGRVSRGRHFAQPSFAAEA